MKNYGLNLENAFGWKLGARERKNWVILEAVEPDRGFYHVLQCVEHL